MPFRGLQSKLKRLFAKRLVYVMEKVVLFLPVPFAHF